MINKGLNKLITILLSLLLLVDNGSFVVVAETTDPVDTTSTTETISEKENEDSEDVILQEEGEEEKATDDSSESETTPSEETPEVKLQALLASLPSKDKLDSLTSEEITNLQALLMEIEELASKTNYDLDNDETYQTVLNYDFSPKEETTPENKEESEVKTTEETTDEVEVNNATSLKEKLESSDNLIVKVTADISYENITVKGTKTLDLNGHTIQNGQNVLTVGSSSESANLTIKDSGSNGMIKPFYKTPIEVSSGSTLTFVSGKLEANVSQATFHGLINKGTTYINGGTLYINENNASNAVIYNQGTLYVSGGTLSDGYTGNECITATSGSYTYVSGGYLKGRNGKEFNNNGGTIVVTGGYFNHDFTSSSGNSINYLGNNYKAKSTGETRTDDNFTYQVVEFTPSVVVVNSDGTNGRGYETIAEAISNVSDKATIKLLSDITTSETIKVSKNITLDLDGHTVSYKYTGSGYGIGYAAFEISSSKSFTIKDSSTNQTGTIETYKGHAISTNLSSTFTLESGRLTSAWSGSNTNATTVSIKGSYSKVNINGGTIDTGDSYAFGMLLWDVASYSTINVTGGTISSYNRNAIFLNQNGSKNTTVNISGGTLKVESKTTDSSTQPCVIYNQNAIAKLNITGGNFDGSPAIYAYTSNVSISGGNYTSYANLATLADGRLTNTNAIKSGYRVADNNDETYKYKVTDIKEASVKIGDNDEVEYETIEKAIEAINNDTSNSDIIIKLLYNCLTDSYVTDATKITHNTSNITLDLNNYKFETGINNDIYLKDGVNLTIVDNTSYKKGELYLYCSKLYVGNNAKLTINSGIVHGRNTNSNSDVLYLNGTDASIEINDTNNKYTYVYAEATNNELFNFGYYANQTVTINGGNVYSDSSFINYKDGGTSNKIIVNGGYVYRKDSPSTNNHLFYNDGVKIIINGGYFRSYGYILNKDGNAEISGGYFSNNGNLTSNTLAEGYSITTYNNSTYKYTVKNNEQASVISGDGTAKVYGTLKQALSAAKDNETVKLLKTSIDYLNKECEVSANNVTLDLNGYTAYIGTSPIVVSGSLTIKSSGSGKLYSKGTDMFKVNGGTLTLESGSLESFSNSTNTIYVDNGNVNIKGGSVYTPSNISSDASTASKAIYAVNGSTVTVSGGKLGEGNNTSSASYIVYSYGIHANNSTVNMSDGYIRIHNGYAIYGENGSTLNVKGVEIDVNNGIALCVTGTTSEATLQTGDNSNNRNIFKAISSNYISSYILAVSGGAKLDIKDNSGVYQNNYDGSVLKVDNGTVTINGSTFYNNGSTANKATIYVTNSSNNKVTINNGWFYNTAGSSTSNSSEYFNVYNAYSSKTAATTVTINDGYFYSNNSNGQLQCYQTNNDTKNPIFGLVVNGGYFATRGNKNSTYNNYVLDVFASGKTVVGSTYTKNGYTYNFKVATPNVEVTYNGSTYYYENLSTALQDSNIATTYAKPATIKLLNDLNEDASTSKAYVTLDLNGKKFGTDGKKGIITVNANNMTITDSSSEKTGSINTIQVNKGYVVNIDSGNINTVKPNATNGTGSFSITGGVFGMDPSKYVNTNFYEVKENTPENGKYTVSIKSEVAVSNFAEFKLAMENPNITKVTVNKSFTMTSDVNAVGTKELTIESGKKITNNSKNNANNSYSINLGSSDGNTTCALTLNGAGEITGNYKEAFNVYKNSSLTIDGTSITTYNGTVSQNTIKVNGGKLTLNSGNITSYASTNTSYNTAVVAVTDNGEVTVTDGKITADSSKALSRRAINSTNSKVTISGGEISSYSASISGTGDIIATGSTVSVTGGKFRHNFNATGNTSIGNQKSYLAEGYVAQDLGSSYDPRFEIVSAYGEVIVKDASGNVVNATDDSKASKYTSLKAALNEAKDGYTITLLRDQVDENSIECIVPANSNITLDLNGKKATINSNPIAVAGNLTIIDSASTGSITAGSSSVSANYNISYTGNTQFFKVNENASLTINGGTYTLEAPTTGSGNNKVFISVVKVEQGGTFTLNGGKLSIGQYASSAKCVIEASGANAVVNVNGGTIDATGKGVIMENQSTFNMSAGTIIGATDGLTLNNSTGNLTGENIKFDDSEKKGGKLLYVYNGSTLNVSGGTYSRNSANQNNSYSLYIESDNTTNSTKGNTVTITGGTFHAYYPAVYTSGVNNNIYISGGYFNASNSGTMHVYTNKTTITGGTYTYGSSSGANIYGSNVTIYGGRFTANKALNAPSGTNTRDYNYQLAEGYSWTSEITNGTTYYIVGPYEISGNTTTDKTKVVVTDPNGNTLKFASLEDAINNSPDGSTLKLSDNLELTKTIEVSKNLTIDLNGKEIKKATGEGSTFTGDSLIKIKGSDNLTINDSSTDSSGKVTASGLSAIEVGETSDTTSAKLTINGGTISGDDSSTEGDKKDVVVIKGKGAEVTLNDGNINATGENVNAISFDTNAENATFTMNNGNLTSKDSSVIDGGSSTNKITINNGTLSTQVGENPNNTNNIINNGTTTGEGESQTTSPTFQVEINGGKFDSGKATSSDDGSTSNEGAAVTIAKVTGDEATTYEVSITGGDYSTNKTIKDLFPESSDNEYRLSDNGEESTYRYSVVSNTEAKLTKTDGTTVEGNLADLISKASDGSTITILNDIKLTSKDSEGNSTATTLTIDKNITLDLNGKTLSTEASGSTVTISKGKNVTIKNGTITDASGTSEGNTNASITVDSGAKLTLGTGNEKVTVGKIIVKGADEDSNANATVDINKNVTTGDITNEGNTNINGGNTGNIDSNDSGSSVKVTGGNTGNISTEGSVEVTGGKTGKITGETKDSNITISGGTVGKDSSATDEDKDVSIETKGGTVTITGGKVEGTIKTNKDSDSTSGGTADIKGGTVGGLDNEGGSTSKIEGGTVDGNVNTGNGSTTDITDGKITGQVTGEGTTNITGGTFNNKPSLPEDSDYVIEETKGNDGSTTYTVIPKDKVVATIEVTKADGSKETKYYSSLQNAIDNADSTSTSTIKLEKDIDNASVIINKNLNLDLNGKKITSGSTGSAITIGKTTNNDETTTGTAINVTISDSSSTKGSISGSKGNTSPTIDLSEAASDSKLTINNATVIGSKGADNSDGNGQTGAYAIAIGDNSVEIKGNAVVTGGDGGNATSELDANNNQTNTTGKGGSGSEAISYKSGESSTGTSTGVEGKITIESSATVKKGSNGCDALSSEAFNWYKKEYGDIIDKSPVTGDNLAKIDEAIAEFKKLTNLNDNDKSQLEEVIKANSDGTYTGSLIDKQAAAKWYADNNTDSYGNVDGTKGAINDNSIGLEDVDKVTLAYKTLHGTATEDELKNTEFKNLSEDASKYISENIKTLIDNKYEAVTFLTNSKWKDALENAKNGTSVDADKINEAKEAYDKLSEDVKSVISDEIKEILSSPDKEAKKAELETYKTTKIYELNNGYTKTNDDGTTTTVDGASEIINKIKALQDNGLSEAQVKDYVDRINSIVDSTKTSINGIELDTTADDLTSSLARAKSNIDSIKKSAEDSINAILTEANSVSTTANKKTDAKKTVDDKADEIKKLIEDTNSGLTEDQKKSLEDALGSAKTSGEGKVDASSDDNVDSATQEAINTLEVVKYKVELEKAKNTAKSTLDNKATTSNNTIDNLSNLSDEDRASYKEKIKSEDSSKSTIVTTTDDSIDEITLDTTNINTASMSSEELKAALDKALDNAIANINKVEGNGESSINAIVEKATSTNNLDKYVTDQKANIDELVNEGKVTKEVADKAKSDIDAKVSETKTNIANASTSDGVSNAYNNGVKDIDTIIDEAKITSEKIIKSKKDEAKESIENKANNATQEIDKLIDSLKSDGSQDDLKDIYEAIKDNINSIKTNGLNDINNESTLTGINDKLSDILDSIDEAKSLANDISSALDELNSAKDEKLKQLDDIKDGLTAEQYNAAKAEIESEVTTATSKIKSVTSDLEVSEAASTAKDNMTSIVQRYTRKAEDANSNVTKELEDEATKAKSVIDSLSGLTEDQKTTYKNSIDEAKTNGEKAIGEATGIENKTKAKEEAIKAIEDIINEAKSVGKKASAIEDVKDKLNDYANTQKTNIDNITDDPNLDKDTLKNAIDEIIKDVLGYTDENGNHVNGTIDGSDGKGVSAEDAYKLYDEAIKKIDKAIDEAKAKSKAITDAKIDEAKGSLDTKSEDAKDYIDSLDELTESQKNELKAKIDEAKKEIEDNLDNSTSDTLKDIEDRLTEELKKITEVKDLADKIVNGNKALEDYANEKKKAIDSLNGLTDEEKKVAKAEIDVEVNKGKDAIYNASKDETDPSTSIDKALEDSKSNIDDVVTKYNKSSDNANKALEAEIDKKVTDVTSKINSMSPLTDEEKKTLIEEVKSKAEEVKKAIESASDASNKKNAKDNGLSAIEDILDKATLANEKAKAKEDLDKYVKDQTANIEKLYKDGELTESAKNEAIKSITESVDSIKNNIDKATSSNDVENAYDDGIKSIDKFISDAKLDSYESIKSSKKDEANSSLEDKANKIKDEINNLPGLDNSQKKDYEAKIDEAIKKAKENINEGTSFDDINSKLTDEVKNLESIKNKAIEDSKSGLAKAKEDAKNSLEEEANKAIADIQNLKNLDEDTKSEYIASIKSELNDAKAKADNETTTDNLASIKDETVNKFKKEVGEAKLEDIRTGKEDLIDSLDGLNNSKDKDSYKEEINKAIDNAKDSLDAATDSSQIDKVIDEAKNNVNKVVDKAREEAKKNNSSASGKLEVADTVYDNNTDKLTHVYLEKNNSNQADLENKLLSDKEIASVDNGNNVKVWLEVNDVTDSVDASNKQAIKSKITSIANDLSSNQTYGESIYLDVALYKKVNGVTTLLTGTSNSVTITMDIPSNISPVASGYTREYRIIRNHTLDDNKTIVTDVIKPSVSGNSISFTTDKFSTYALVYIDTTINNSNNNNSPQARSCEEVHGKGWTWMGDKLGCRYKVSNTNAE